MQRLEARESWAAYDCGIELERCRAVDGGSGSRAGCWGQVPALSLGDHRPFACGALFHRWCRASASVCPVAGVGVPQA